LSGKTIFRPVICAQYLKYAAVKPKLGSLKEKELKGLTKFLTNKFLTNPGVMHTVRRRFFNSCQADRPINSVHYRIRETGAFFPLLPFVGGLVVGPNHCSFTCFKCQGLTQASNIFHDIELSRSFLSGLNSNFP
jgi:hypothetical protein